MDTITLEVPASLYAKLQSLAEAEHLDPVAVIDRLVETAQPSITLMESDPVFELIGAYQSEAPLIDGISVSEDPDLYLAAAALGEQAAGLHAWELAPTRYMQGPDQRPARRIAESNQTV